MSKKLMRIALWVLFINVVLIGVAAAQTISLNVQDEPTGSATARIFNIILLITVLSIAPSILVMMTSFTRYIISLSFLRNAMGTQQTPPNTVLVGIALFLTLITMNPVLTRIGTEAWEPYTNQEIGAEEFVDRASVPLKEFMMANTQWRTVEMYCDLAHIDVPEEGNRRSRSCPFG